LSYDQRTIYIGGVLCYSVYTAKESEMDTKELKTNVEKLAEEEGKTILEIISELQAGASKIGNDEVLDALCELKWEHINNMNVK